MPVQSRGKPPNLIEPAGSLNAQYEKGFDSWPGEAVQRIGRA